MNTNEDKLNNEERIKYLETILNDYSLEVEGEGNLSAEEYEDLLREYETLLRKNYNEESHHFWDEVSLWVIFYGFIQLIINIPYILYHMIGVQFGGFLLRIFIKSSANVNDYLIFTIGFYSIAFINLMLTWFIILNFIKKREDKIFMYAIWAYQGLLTIGFGLYYLFSIVLKMS